jgi:hypothetical protein
LTHRRTLPRTTPYPSYGWGRHYLLHDGEHRNWGVEQLKSAEEMFYNLGLRNIILVPRTPNLTIAIRQCRDAFPSYRFDLTVAKPACITSNTIGKAGTSAMVPGQISH